MLANLPWWQRPASCLVLTLLVFGASFFPEHTFAQTFNGSTTNTAGNSMIPSVNTGGCGVEPQTAGTGGTRFNCAVAGVVPGNVLDRVNVNLTHTSTGELDIFLVSPSGAVLELSTDNGGSGDNFTNTVFRDNAPTSITAGTAPFTGSFRPEGTLIAVNCGITITPTVTTVVGMGDHCWHLAITYFR